MGMLVCVRASIRNHTPAAKFLDSRTKQIIGEHRKQKSGAGGLFYSETENLLPRVIQREIISFMNFPGDVTEWVGLTIILISALFAALLLWELI